VTFFFWRQVEVLPPVETAKEPTAETCLQPSVEVHSGECPSSQLCEEPQESNEILRKITKR
jgi:hypothetical protein